MAGVRRAGRRHELVASGAVVVAMVLAGCAAEVVTTPVPPTPSPTPAPTPTPAPGLPLAAGYRPEGPWTVSFARPGDIVRETYDIALTCPDGACDAIVRITDDAGTDLGKGTFELVDDRYVHTATTTRTVDCKVADRTVPRGAIEEVETELVLATYRLAGTAQEHPEIHGTRPVVIAPGAGSDCAPSTIVYPATGEPAGVQP